MRAGRFTPRGGRTLKDLRSLTLFPLMFCNEWARAKRVCALLYSGQLASEKS
jgi:hypothetical protein